MLRHLLSIVLLPFTVTVIVPGWLLTARGAFDTRWPDRSILAPAGHLVGTLVFVAGLGLFVWCVALFARLGRGTLAPWDPTRRLVAAGPYRHVRNPMISAVAAMLLGEAIFFGSALMFGWSVAFVIVNHVYFVVSEERGLERRFGDAYRQYKEEVPRWLPRIR